MTKELESRAAGAAASLDQVRQSVSSDLQYVSMQVDGKAYGGWYRLLPDGRMELLALANMHCERRPESSPLEQARGMLAEFIRAARTGGPGAPADTRQDKAQLTIGDLLHADKSTPLLEEADWVGLVRSMAAGDPLALDALFERAYCLVYTVIARLVGDRDLAEELTLDVFHDVWRQARDFDPAAGPVLAWLLNQARLRALEQLARQAAGRETGHAREHGAWLREAVTGLMPTERQLIESAYFSRKDCRELAAQEQQPVDAIRKQIHEGLEKLRKSLDAGAAGP